MKKDRPDYELPIAGLAWTQGSGAPAGIYLLRGRSHLVAESSPAEAALLAQGAMQIASVRWDRPQVDTGFDDRTVRVLPSDQAVCTFAAHNPN